MEKCKSNDVLKSTKLKLTRQRIRLLNEIIDMETTFTAGSLYKKVKDDMDLVTIYRVLNVFSKNKIIREVLSNNETKIYEMSCIHNPLHPHFYCRSCNKLFCLSELNQEDYISLQKYSKNFLVDSISIQIYGLCDKCKQFAKNT